MDRSSMGLRSSGFLHDQPRFPDYNAKCDQCMKEFGEEE